MTTKPTKVRSGGFHAVVLGEEGISLSFFRTTTRSGCLKKTVTKQNPLFIVLVYFMYANNHFICFNEVQ